MLNLVTVEWSTATSLRRKQRYKPASEGKFWARFVNLRTAFLLSKEYLLLCSVYNPIARSKALQLVDYSYSYSSSIKVYI